MTTITDLQPKLVWEIFDAITRVPRPSKKEGQIIEYLIDFAKQHGLAWKKDSAGNVLMTKPATPGMENRPTVVLQSHMDMVCEKNASLTFDFEKDAIRTRIDGEWVKADGTTLGADDGIGMAAALAVLIDPLIEHPAVEALFTVDEETGLTGAFNLGEDMLTGKYLINLDSEDEGEIFIGCAGGIDTLATMAYTPEPIPAGYRWMRIDVSGLKGGHSGDNIGDGLGNSNKLLTRILLPGAASHALRLHRFDGGNLRNAIPREAYAVAGVPEAEWETFRSGTEQLIRDITEEYRFTDAGVKITVSDAEAPAWVIDAAAQENLLLALQGVANGVLAMSRAMAGLVETSTNLASVKFVDGNRIVITTSQRSSIVSARNDAAATVAATLRLAGAQVQHSEGYPGWAPDPDNRLLDVTKRSYEALFHAEPKVRAIHAGLECGLFLEKYPDLEMVSFGPTLRGVHSPDERLEIATVQKFWDLLVEVLRRI